MAWKTTFLFAFLAQLIGVIGFSFATPFLPFFVGDLGVSDAGEQAFLAGIVMSSGGLTFALFAPIWGMLADRYGRKSMVCRAMFGGALSLLLMSFAQTVPQLAVCRLFQGMFSGTVSASIALVASVTPLSRSGFALGMMQASVFSGNVIGPFFGGLAADRFGYRISFRLGAVMTMIAGVLTLLGTREQFQPPGKGGDSRIPGFRKILLLPGFLLGAIILFGVRFSNSISNPSFPLIIQEMDVSQAALNTVTGTIIGIAAVAGAVAAGLLGHISDRLGRERVLAWCCIGGGVASVGHYAVDSIPGLLVMRMIFGFSVAGMMPAANALIKSVVDNRSIGKAFGLATSLSMTGAAVGPALGGWLAMKTGIRSPFLITAAAQFALMVLIFLFFSKRKGSKPADHR